MGHRGVRTASDQLQTIDGRQPSRFDHRRHQAIPGTAHGGQLRPAIELDNMPERRRGKIERQLVIAGSGPHNDPPVFDRQKRNLHDVAVVTDNGVGHIRHTEHRIRILNAIEIVGAELLRGVRGNDETVVPSPRLRIGDHQVACLQGNGVGRVGQPEIERQAALERSQRQPCREPIRIRPLFLAPRTAP